MYDDEESSASSYAVEILEEDYANKTLIIDELDEILGETVSPGLRSYLEEKCGNDRTAGQDNLVKYL